MGISSATTSRCTPNAIFMEAAICLNFSTSISEKESSSTKKHIKSDIRSANVPIHAGAPAGGGLRCGACVLVTFVSSYWLAVGSVGGIYGLNLALGLVFMGGRSVGASRSSANGHYSPPSPLRFEPGR